MPNSAISSSSVDESVALTSGKTISVLSYVHLRNIHNSTGAGRVARQLTEHLAARSDIRLRILADAADRDRTVPLVGAPWDKFDYSCFDSETSRQQAKWFLFDSPKAESFWPGVQVVFCTAESYVPTRTAQLVVTLHDAAYFEQAVHQRNRSFWKTRLKWRLLYGKLARKADLFHTVSQFSADRLAHFFPGIGSRLRVVPNAVTPHFYSPVSDAGRAYLEANGLTGRPFVLVPGGLHFRKNAELILEAWPLLKRSYPDLVLAVVNHSAPEYVERAKTLGESFRLLGFVSDDALRALYAAAQVVWFPSRYEGFGMPVIEAMACGAAVVTSRSSSLPEIAGDAALLADPARTQDHIDALSALLDDSRFRADLASRGRARAAHFTWQSSAKQMKTHFDSLL